MGKHSNRNLQSHVFRRVGRPIFLPSWWKNLQLRQKFLLGVHFCFYALGVILFCDVLVRDSYFSHVITLVGLRKVGFPDQAVYGEISITVQTGFWRHSSFRVKTFDSKDAAHKSHIETHISMGQRLWGYCTRVSHRARASYYMATILLVIGLAGYFSAYYLAIFSRILMLHVTLWSSLLFMTAFLLVYATSLEYNGCVVGRQQGRTCQVSREYISYHGRFFMPSLRFVRENLIQLTTAVILGFLPMDIIAWLLIVKYSDKL